VTKNKTLVLYALPSGDRVPLNTMTDRLFRMADATSVGFSPDGQRLFASRDGMDGLIVKTSTYFWNFGKVDAQAPLSLGGEVGSRRLVGTSNGAYHSIGLSAASPDQTKFAVVVEWRANFGLILDRTLNLYDLTKQDPKN
jgi:WD40 repeat protein